MKVLLDTNIIIHRETDRIINEDIGKLFNWLDKIKADKLIHPVTEREINRLKNSQQKQTFNIKLESYTKLVTKEILDHEVKKIAAKYDINNNDNNDTLLLNEVYIGSVDCLITEDKKIHKKAIELGIADKVFTIEQFIEKSITEHPNLLDYKVLSVQKSYFGRENLDDPFFNSFKEDYPEFEKWFRKKSNEPIYVSKDENNNIQAFLYLKVEDSNENYSDIEPIFQPKKRLKIGTFKVALNGFRLGERFLKIIFDNAAKQRVDEIYVTIFERRDEQIRLINLLEDWGFIKWGIKKSTGEIVMTRNFAKSFNIANPRLTYPFISLNERNKIFIVPIWPEYHTELFPDSILRTESPDDFKEDKPHRNAISKIYISRSVERNVNKGDILLFYRTAEKDKSAYYTAVVTTIAIVEEIIDNIQNENEFILKCRKRSVFSNEELKKWWNYKTRNRPFIINFLHVYSFQIGERVIRKRLLELGILTGEENELRGLKPISKDNFLKIIKEAKIDESFIIY
ncbi:MAG: PIN domain-containing protein [Bacteroidota bacterium]|mgnify:CR=1 FL=1